MLPFLLWSSGETHASWMLGRTSCRGRRGICLASVHAGRHNIRGHVGRPLLTPMLMWRAGEDMRKLDAGARV